MPKCVFLEILKSYNYNCHNIYWDPLIWLVKNGHLIALTCISFFNEPGPYSWGAGPFTTELLLWYCAMLLWREMDSLQLLTLYLTLTPIFSVRKAKINLHTTPKLTAVMPISCLLPCADPGIFVRRGGPRQSDKKSSDNVVTFVLFSVFFFCFLVLSLFYRSQMVNFKEKYHFSRFRRGGVHCLFPLETNITWLTRGCPDPLSPLWIRTWLQSYHLFSFPVRKMMRSPLAPVLVFLQLRCMFSVEPRNKIVSWTYCMTVAHGLSNIFCNSSLLSSITH